MGVKVEAVAPGPGQRRVGIASRNFHRDLFTSRFRIGDGGEVSRMHSACVAFGMERLLLTLLHATEHHDPERLVARLEQAASATNAGEGIE